MTKQVVVLIVLVLSLASFDQINPSIAQSDNTVEVVFQITRIEANNLNEDGIFDDGMDEMDFTYTIYEVDDDGIVVQSVEDSYLGNFRTGTTVNPSNASLSMVVDTSNTTYIVVSAIERDDSATGRCAAYGIGEIIECVFGTSSGDCDIEFSTALACFQALGDSDLFEEAYITSVNLANTSQRSIDIVIEDVGLNSAEYDVRFSLDVDPSSRSAARPFIGYQQLFFGSITSSDFFEFYVLSLDQGDNFTAIATPTSGNLDTILVLFDSDEEVVASNDDASAFDTTNSIIEYRVPSSGIYYLGITRYEGEEGDTFGDFFIEVSSN